MMNLSQFLIAVDNTTATMSKENLTEFVHDIARTLPEKEREDFLARLDGMCGKNGKAILVQQERAEELTQAWESLKEKLECIENGELCLEGCPNEEYDDWYNIDADEFLFSDPQGVLTIIEEACRFLHQCIDREEYETGCEIAEILIGLEIMVGGEYEDYSDEPIDICDLDYYHLGQVDYKALVIGAAHAVYCSFPLQERAGVLYKIFENSGKRDITLEMVMQNGSELPDMDAFLPLWIEYLGEQSTGSAERLLREALELGGSRQQLLASARKYCGLHPELYEQYLLNNQGQEDIESLLAVGEEAVGAIDQKYLVRSRIALFTGRIALVLDRQDEAERYWLEAFRSDTRVVNYLRLLMECRDFSKVREAARQIYSQAYPQPVAGGYFYPSATDRKENQTDAMNAYMLAFLGGEFSFVRNMAMNRKGSLGWSATFMKCGLAAFLLLLTESSEPETGAVQQGVIPRGSREMLRLVTEAVGFRKTEYENGILKTIDESDRDWFWKCWLHWKKMISISEEERKELLQWTERLITMRVKGIMEGNHRKYYGECAAYIAALGEAKESGGERNGKQNTMAKYMEAYSRRSAFRQEMRAFGMRDLRKK